MTTKRIDLQRLLAEEPFVRSLARSLVAEEADDVVQQAFLQALESRPDPPLQLRWWLARIVRNLVTDRRRRALRRDARQRAAAVPERVPSSSELLEAEERRGALVAAVDRLPADQRTVVLLRYYEGLPPRRIAAELQVPVATVRSRLHAALQTLRLRLDADHGGDRRAWLLPLVPFAARPRALPWDELTRASPASAISGVIAMTAKTKFVAAVATLMVLAGAWAVWPGSGIPAHAPQGDTARVGPLAAHADAPGTQTDASTSGGAQRAPVALPTTDAPTTGALVVHVLYPDEPKAADGLTVSVGPPGGDFRVGLQRSVTDASGTARFAAVAPGKLWVRASRLSTRELVAEVRPGETSECTLRLGSGMSVSGVVVDADGVPIGGAQVDVGTNALADAEAVAVTAVDGTFTARSIFPICFISARAAGHAASLQQVVSGHLGGAEKVRIVLSAPGGMVGGVVLAPDGHAVPDAVVRIGKGTTDLIIGNEGEPLPAQVVTNAEGLFRAVGVPVGTQPLMVRAAGLAPWSGTCEVAAGGTVSVRVVLSSGVTCVGVVRTEAGQPAAAVTVTSGSIGDFLQFRTITAADGSFVLAGLPVSEVELSAKAGELGKAKAVVHGEAGSSVRCELALSNGLALRGRLVDQTGAPVNGVDTSWEARGVGPRWSQTIFTDTQGCFVVPDCPAGRPLSVYIEGPGLTPCWRHGFDPRAARDGIELEVERDTSPPGHVIGRVVGPDDKPIEGLLDVQVLRRQTMHDTRFASTAADGRFAMEVTTGTWALSTRIQNHPTVRLDDREVTSGTTWDVGTIRLPQGGRVAVRETVAGAGKHDYLVVFDARERFCCGVYAPSPPLRSELLVPGSYVLLARGEGLASQTLPFAIEPGRETELEVRAITGVRQRIEFVHAAGAELPSRISFAVRRAGRLVLWDSATFEPAGPLVREIWLAPGSYTLATREGEPAGTAAFTIGSAEGPTVRVELR